MAFCRNIATGSDQDASGCFKLAQIDAPSRSGLKWAIQMTVAMSMGFSGQLDRKLTV
jgi:hypothetical protein